MCSPMKVNACYQGRHATQWFTSSTGDRYKLFLEKKIHRIPAKPANFVSSF
jgi:hypothetical protein